jgi:hypothetical protein
MILPQVVMSVCLQCCYHKKPYRMYLLFSALCGNASTLAFGACFVAQLTDFKLLSTDFHMYVLTHVVFSGDLGRELVCNRVTRLLGKERERDVKVAL